MGGVDRSFSVPLPPRLRHLDPPRSRYVDGPGLCTSPVTPCVEKYAAELIPSVASSRQAAFPSPRPSLDLVFVRDPRDILGISWAEISSQEEDDRRRTPAVDRLCATTMPRKDEVRICHHTL